MPNTRYLRTNCKTFCVGVTLSSAGKDAACSGWTSTNHTYMTEPRVNLIKEQIESLLELVDLEKKGKVVAVDGFRLKNLSYWVGPVRPSAFANVGAFSSVCSLRCVFCSELGNKTLPWSEKRRYLTLQEARTYMKYYSDRGKGIFPLWAPSLEHMENRDFIEILKIIRDKAPEEYFEFPTNGRYLTEPMVKALARLGPLSIMVSLHSADPEIRRQLMKDPNPEIAINGVKLLNRYRIPFEGSAVPWPTLPLDDLERTIRYLSENNAYRIILNLPSWTKEMSKVALFDTDKVWSKIVDRVDRLRAALPTPIVYGPNLYAEKNGIPRITGTLKNSPGHRTGLKFGDIVKEIDGIPVFAQFQARYYLWKSLKRDVVLKIQRGGETLKVKVAKDKNYEYPYLEIVEKQVGLTKGIAIPEGFHPMDLRKLERIINRRKPKRALFLSARTLKPFFEEQLNRFYELEDLELFIEVPRHRFWGGNIIDGSIYMVDDYIAHIRDFIRRKGFRPDLAIIPSSSFSAGGWRRDYFGKTYDEIERKTAVPIEIIETQQIGF